MARERANGDRAIRVAPDHLGWCRGHQVIMGDKRDAR
jgi:hypothetical protein